LIASFEKRRKIQRNNSIVARSALEKVPLKVAVAALATNL